MNIIKYVDNCIDNTAFGKNGRYLISKLQKKLFRIFNVECTVCLYFWSRLIIS